MKSRYTIALLLVTAIAACQLLSAGEGEPLVYGFSETVTSKILGEDRPILIRLPETYQEGEAEYPLLVVLDGAAEVFLRAVASVDYLEDMQEGFPEYIVVGIPNTDRFRDLYILNQPDQFMGFLEQELLPWIAERYRCNGVKTLYGQSFSSIFAGYCAMREPSLFQNYMLNSWGLSDREIQYYRTLLNADREKEMAAQVWVYVTSNETDPYDQERSRRRLAKAYFDELQASFPNRFMLQYRLYDFAGHAPFQGLHDGLVWIHTTQK